MPTWLRQFTFTQIQDHYDKEKEEAEKARGGQSWNSSSTPSPPPSVQRALQENKAYRAPAPKPK